MSPSRRLMAIATAASLLVAQQTPVLAQVSGPSSASDPAQQSEPALYNTQQLDALLAPIALYPDPLLTQVLMASAYPIDIVNAARWLKDGRNATLTGDALVQALTPQPWDPSVKSLVPFPTVLGAMNEKLDWTQQLGYAFAMQQADVMNAVQRLRAQPEMVVRSEAQTIILEPAQPNVVYVPSYNPTVAYGAWPYPAVPPVMPPPMMMPSPGAVMGNALLTGLAFGAGIAITAALFDMGRPNWGGGTVIVNNNHYNAINAGRPPIRPGPWQPPPRPTGGGYMRPPPGPVGRPSAPGHLPPGAIGRPSVQVPGSALNRPNFPPPGQANRPVGGQSGGIAANRPPGGPPPGNNRPGSGAAAGNRPQPGANRPPPATAPAFSGRGDGNKAPAYAQRGQQSRQAPQAQRPPSRPSGGEGGGPPRQRPSGGGSGLRGQH